MILTLLCIAGAAWALPSNTQQARLSPEVQELTDIYWNWRLSDMPEYASFVGIHDYDDRLDDVSLGAWIIRNSKCEQLMFLANLIEPSLTDRYDLLNINILKNELQTYMDGYPLMAFTLPLNYMEGIQTDLERLVSWMKLENLVDYEKLLNRYRAVPDQIAQIQTLMETGVKRGITNHAISMKGVGADLGRFVVSSFDESPLWQPFVNLTGVVTPEEADVLRATAGDIILNNISPAFASLQSYVEETYVTRADIAITSIPTGPEMYEQLLRFHTSTNDLTAEDIHEIGLNEVIRIEGEMAKIVSELGYNMTVPEFSAMIKNDSQFFYDSPEELMAGFEDIVYNRIQPNLPLAFINIPKAELVLVENPSADGPPAFYTAASFDGSRPGVFFVNTELYASQPQYDMMTLSLHEGNPGHHLQGSHSLESPNIPFFRRAMEDRNYGISPSRFPMNTAFIEGWGLYSEAIGFDMDMYENLYERYGHYSYEAWRAVRLVIDTGMHALGWTREEAIEYMMEHTALSDQVVKNEVDRYITWPGQALAYKVGMLKFVELRQRAIDQLGDSFDLRNFHDVLLDSVGPLDIVEEEINTWIAGGGY